MAEGRTVPELLELSLPVQATDETVVYRSGGNLKRADMSDIRTYMQSNLGTIATQNANNVAITGGSITGITDLAVTDGGTGASNASAARTNLGLGIGTDVQAYNARLQDISANLTATSGTVEKTGANTFGTYTVTAAGKALMDDADAAAQRTTLAAVGTAELAASGGSALVGFLQAGSGAVSRTVQAKLRDFVSVTDFGATGNGTTNDAAAIALAVTACSSGKTLYFPPGEYLVTATTVDAAVVLPAGVNLYMEPGAWLIAGTSFGSFIAPLGNNIIVCNIDGRGYPSSGGVTGTWTIENVGIRAYFSAPIGLGADNVTIVNSQIKNVSYGVFGVGSEKWRVQNNYIHRVKQSCVQFGFYLNQNSLHNLVYGNTFEDAGDYAVVYYQQSGQSDGIGAYNSTIGNTAKNMNQRTNGYAYGVEQGTVAKQVGFVFADNVYETDVTTGSVTLGGITITTTTDSVVSGNLLKGSLGSSGDVGINCLQAINATITGNNISSFRGGAVDVDGSSGALVQANSIKNCGGASASSSPLIVAQLYSTSNINVIGNTFEVSSGYAYYGAAVSCIYVESIVSTTVSGVSILNNTFVNPNDRALTVQGVSASLVTKLTFAGNVIRGIGDATFFAREPVYMDYAKNVVVSANAVSDAKRGYVISNCEYVVWQNNNNSGTETISTPFYTVTSTTNMRINWNTNSQTLGGAGLTPIAQFVVANGNFSRGDVVLATENYGVTGVIATGATVNHGLTVTPTNVIITPADTGVTDFYVSALGATTFVINYSGGGTHAFYWQATY